MQYLGGKSRIASQLASVMLSSHISRDLYIEPFLGAGSVATLVAPLFDRVILSDAQEDLMLMWHAALSGWEPPREVTEDMYNEQKEAPPSALRGFVGFPCSFGGKWFGGYARDPKNGRSFADVAARSLLKKTALLQPLWDSGRLTLHRGSYVDVRYETGALVYADPPYSNTTAYKGAGKFDTAAFWDDMKHLSREVGCDVYVSEYTAPTGWYATWEGSVKSSLAGKGSDREVKESLFKRGHK